MKNLVILGAGTAGTMVANHMRRRLPGDWTLSVIDPSATHVYQPDLLFVPFGKSTESKYLRPRARTLGRGVEWINEAVEAVDTDAREVVLAGGGRVDYDLLVIATGSHIHPEETEGMMDDWRGAIHDFYTVEGARALQRALTSFDEGRLVINIVEMPIKCPIAPLEFAFLSDAYFQDRGIRDRVQIDFVTPLDGAFTQPIASGVLGNLLGDKGINVVADFATGEVDAEGRVLRSWDEREVPYDLLVSIPTHMGADFLAESGLGDELNFVPTEKTTLKAREHDDIFVIGDATDLPTSKAGSVAHFESEVLVQNLERAIAGRSLVETFDGHANCFIESGHGKALLLDFNYTVEPMPGTFPLPYVGPFSLLKESRLNHWGKLAFRWVYWNRMIKGKSIPVPNRMQMSGKRQPRALLTTA